MGAVLTSGTSVAVDGWDHDLGTIGSEDKVYVQSGDVAPRSAAVWARCNREAPARLVVEVWEEDADDDMTGAVLYEKVLDPQP